MGKTTVKIWNHSGYGTKKVKIHKNGTLDYNASLAFRAGHCHSLALAFFALVGWPIYAIIGSTDSFDSPGHIVVKNPKNGAFVDIQGTRAVRRYKKIWGKVELRPVKPEEIYKFDTYLCPNVKAALPFAQKILNDLGVQT